MGGGLGATSLYTLNYFMKQLLKLLPFFLLFTSIILSQKDFKYDKVLQVNEGLPKLGFIIEKTGSDSFLVFYEIKIYNAKSNKLIQSFNMTDYDIYYSKYEFPIDSLVDFNFDGYKDLKVYGGSGQNGKNSFYSIFLYDSLTGKFYKNPSFDSIYNFIINQKNKTIEEYTWPGACAWDCVTWNTYVVENNKLVLIGASYVEIDAETNKAYRIIEKYEDGNLISKDKVSIEEEIN
jgi:hypothetical protein